MILEVIVRPEAKEDLREAKAWYRSISAELRNDFVRRVDDAISLACERPLAFQVVHRTFRRILLHRFPYALITTSVTIASSLSQFSIRREIQK
jgi:plasmid stabilization system protein ParE